MPDWWGLRSEFEERQSFSRARTALCCITIVLYCIVWYSRDTTKSQKSISLRLTPTIVDFGIR